MIPFEMIDTCYNNEKLIFIFICSFLSPFLVSYSKINKVRIVIIHKIIHSAFLFRLPFRIETSFNFDFFFTILLDVSCISQWFKVMLWSCTWFYGVNKLLWIFLELNFSWFSAFFTRILAFCCFRLLVWYVLMQNVLI